MLGGRLLVVPVVLVFLHNRPEDRGVCPYGASAGLPTGTVGHAGTAVRRASMRCERPPGARTFWALAGGFAICGATTNGLIGTHFIPAAHDHGLSEPTAAGLLAVVGVFDIVGTLASGYLTDRFNPRVLLAVYYSLRGAGLVMLPGMLSDSLHPA